MSNDINISGTFGSKSQFRISMDQELYNIIKEDIGSDPIAEVQYYYEDMSDEDIRKEILSIKSNHLIIVDESTQP